MLVATFGPGSGWAGKKITHEDGQFVLEGSGPVSAAQVLAFEGAAPLVWSTQGTRAWVGSLARAAAPAAAPAACFFDRAHYVAGPTGLGPAADGRLWVTAEFVGIQVPDGSVVASIALDGVTAFDVRDEQAAGSGVAASLRIGSFSLGNADAEDRAILVAHLTSGEAATYVVDQVSAGDLRASVGPIIALARVPFAEAARETAEPDRIAKIERLAALNAEGVLTDADFRAELGPVVTEALPAGEAEAVPGARPVPRPAFEAAVERLTAMRLAGLITDAELSAMKAKLLE